MSATSNSEVNFIEALGHLARQGAKNSTDTDDASTDFNPMTTYSPETVVCGACGRAFRHEALMSTNAFGACDLDTRPPEMARSTLRTQVQRCPSCGFCATEVNKFDPKHRSLIESDAYKKQFIAPEYPELASTFLCAGMLAEGDARHQEAGWLFLRAAWVCDDHKRDEVACQCRCRAADQFTAAMAQGPMEGQAGAPEAILTDCLRRAGRSEKALEVIGYAERGECEPFIRKVLAFQRALIERGDTACHTVEEVM